MKVGKEKERRKGAVRKKMGEEGRKEASKEGREEEKKV